jgi:hypothetical protein
MQANPTPSPETLEKLANGLAQLQDFRLLFYVLIILLFLMVLERAWAAAGMRKERKDMVAERQQMWAVADRFSEAAREYGENTDKLVVELQVLRALTARVETTNAHPQG